MEILEKRIHKILSRISSVADFRRISSDILRGDTEVAVSGLSGSARALFIAGLWQSLRRPLIVVTPQDRGVSALTTDIAYFHGELTGRENIYLNGAILGMKRREIARKFDEIVAFAGAFLRSIPNSNYI